MPTLSDMLTLQGPLMFLVDTNVISEVRKGKRADPGVVAFWAEAVRNDTPIFLASVTIGELRRGVELIRYRGDQQQAGILEQWLEQVLIDYGDRVLSLDCDAAHVRCGSICRQTASPIRPLKRWSISWLVQARQHCCVLRSMPIPHGGSARVSGMMPPPCT